MKIVFITILYNVNNVTYDGTCISYNVSKFINQHVRRAWYLNETA
jgi:hypothetical protein